MNDPVQLEDIVARIHSMRGAKVMLDVDLATIFQVETKRLNQQVNRNRARFPDDFMFQLSPEEWDNLRLQNATSSWGGRRYPPFAFTEHGAVMIATILKTEQAIQASIYIVRAFVKLRGILKSHEELLGRMNELERKVGTNDRHFQLLVQAFEVLRQQVERHADKELPPVGFKIGSKDPSTD